MYDNDSKGISYTAGFFMLIAFVIAGLMLTSQLSIMVWTNMTGKSIMMMKNASPEDSNAFKIIQILTSIFTFLLPTIITANILSRKPFKLLGFTLSGIKRNQAGLVVLIVGASLLVSASLSYFTELIPISTKLRTMFENLEEDYTRQVSAILTLRSPVDFVLALIIMAFLPALGEETMFRGGLQNFLSRGTKSPWLSIIVVSLLFSIAHASYYGFLSRVFLGIVLGAIYHYSGRLWLSILAHFLNNALAITLLYVYTQQGKPFKEAMRESEGTPWGVIGIPIVILLFVAFQKQSTRRTEYIS